MKEQKIRFTPIPSTAEVEAERERLAYRSRYMRVLRSTVYTLLVVAAIAVLLATLFLPVLQVSGDSMNPTLQDRDIILLVKGSDMKTGDLCGFYKVDPVFTICDTLCLFKPISIITGSCIDQE